MQSCARWEPSSVDARPQSVAPDHYDAIATRWVTGGLTASLALPTHTWSVGRCIQIGFGAVLGQAACREYSLISPCTRVRLTT